MASEVAAPRVRGMLGALEIYKTPSSLTPFHAEGAGQAQLPCARHQRAARGGQGMQTGISRPTPYITVGAAAGWSLRQSVTPPS